MRNSLRILCIALVQFISTSVCYSQNSLGAAGVINDIKKSSDYLYAEYTSAEWREAIDNASLILEKTIDDWIYVNHVEASISEVLEGKMVIRARRGDLFRAFVYVNKPSSGQAKPVVESQPQPEASPAPEPLIPEVTVPSIVLSQQEKDMINVTTFDQIQPLIKRYVANNTMRDYGKYATLPDGPAYLFVYNRAGEVVAVIRKDDTTQINIRTGVSDDVKQYKDCGAIWFRFK